MITLRTPFKIAATHRVACCDYMPSAFTGLTVTWLISYFSIMFIYAITFLVLYHKPVMNISTSSDIVQTPQILQPLHVSFLRM